MTRTINGISVPFRYVPAGSFQRDSTPANVTIITRGYWMGETEVTQELFLAVMGVNPSDFTSGAEVGEDQNKRPVERVRWYDAIAFCNKLSLADGKEPVYSVSGVIDWNTVVIPATDTPAWNDADMDTGKNGYRLPTEMEWMWAAMGADKTVQPNTTGYDKGYAGSAEGSGQINLGDYAWYSGNSGSKTHEAGKKDANELGLYDMNGNVVEWCWDWWYGSYPGGNQWDPQGASSGASRVRCGGGWSAGAANMRPALRGSNSPSWRSNDLGFRVVCP
jgi:formylglycine-generating enzyme required for sulfatase activity